MIRSREINLRASALINWFPIQTCCAQSRFSHYNAMLEAKNIVKGFQIHPFCVFYEQRFLIGWIHNNQWNWIMLSQLLFQYAKRMKLKCDCALMNPASYALFQELKNGRSCLSCFWFPLFLMPKLHLFIKEMNNNKLMITQRVNPPSLNMQTEGDWRGRGDLGCILFLNRLDSSQ